MNDNINIRRYYAIRDVVADDFSDMWPAKNNADALRCFHHTLATQLKNGVITSVDDYELFFVGNFISDSTGSCFKSYCEQVCDNEDNNKESE